MKTVNSMHVLKSTRRSRINTLSMSWSNKLLAVNTRRWQDAAFMLDNVADGGPTRKQHWVMFSVIWAKVCRASGGPMLSVFMGVNVWHVGSHENTQHCTTPRAQSPYVCSVARRIRIAIGNPHGHPISASHHVRVSQLFCRANGSRRRAPQGSKIPVNPP